MNKCKRYFLGAFFISSLISAPPVYAADDLPFFSPYPKIDSNRWYISSGWTNGDYMSCEWQAKAITVDDHNLKLTLSNHGVKSRQYACPEIHTQARTGYGSYSTRVRSAAGSGLNTAFFTYVGPGLGSTSHDEIDFEFLGKDPTTVQTNYYVGGKPQDQNIVHLGFDASAGFHDYTFVWEPTKITWYIDGKKVHESKAGTEIPTNPGRIYMSLWSGAKGEDDWLGPFKYEKDVSAEFSWVKFTPLH